MHAKLRNCDLLLAAGAIVLFVSVLLPWFSLPAVSDALGRAPGAHLVGEGSTGPVHLNVWDLAWVRWIVFLSLLLGFWTVVAALFSRTADWSTILCTPLVVVSGITAICLVVRLFNAPRPSASMQPGFYLAVVGGLALFAGACWALRDDTTPDGFDRAPRPELIHVD